jgi:hypothetical protein
MNVGVVRDFHDQQHGIVRDVEGYLSREESRFAQAIARWQGGGLSETDSAIADSLVAHLRLRGRTLREFGEKIVSRFSGQLHQEIAAAIERLAPTRPLLQVIDSLTVARPDSSAVPSESPQPQIRDDIARHFAFWVTSGVWEVCRAMMTVETQGLLLRAAHSQLVLSDLVNRRRRQAFGPFRWFVAQISRSGLVLGDIGPVCQYPGRRGLHPLGNTSVPTAVYLPIGLRRVLVGTDVWRLRTPSFETLNLATVRLSREFVVGGSSERHLRRLQPRLGDRSHEDTPKQCLGYTDSDPAPFVNEAVKDLYDAMVESARSRL